MESLNLSAPRCFIRKLLLLTFPVLQWAARMQLQKNYMNNVQTAQQPSKRLFWFCQQC